MVMTLYELEQELYYSLDKYNLNYEKEVFLLRNVATSTTLTKVIIVVYVNKIEKYKQIAESHKFNHKKLTAWLQNVFDDVILSQRLMTITYKFVYRWYLPGSEKGYSYLHEITK